MRKEDIKIFIDGIENPAEPNQALIDAAQRYEKYSERFDNDESAIGNPETWGKRIVEEPKQETAVEWLEDCLTEQYPNGSFVWNTRADLEALFKQAKQMEKQQQGYSEEVINDMFDTLKRNSVDNVATITNVDLFISSWKRELKNK